MPIYEYTCSNCGHKFEKMCSLSQSSQGVPCPKCHARGERRLSRFACVSTGSSGETHSIAGGGGGCSSCGSSSCSSCGH